MKKYRIVLNFVTVVLLTAVSIATIESSFNNSVNLSLLSQPARSQPRRIRPSEVWRLVYEKLPELPLENQYINTETGEVDADNTLVKRLLRYHLFVKSRPPQYRLDWKLTLADYLNANEIIQESIYPGHNTLLENPMAGDKEAIARLNRLQRDAVIEVLVSIYNPDYANESASERSPASTTAPAPNSPPRSQPGDAQLLMP